jgi:putative heme iron utilization protein
MSEAREKSTKELSRALLRGTRVATLATRLADKDEGASAQPYASKALIASGHDGAPLLLFSDLAQHAGNLAAAPQASLLLDPAGGADLDRPRLTLLGDILPLGEGPAADLARSRYQRLHPSSQRYASFGDFRLYRMEISALHLVAGFGRVRWFKPDELLPPPLLAAAFADSEEKLLARNRALFSALGPASSGPWQAVALDCDGIDYLSPGQENARDSVQDHWRRCFPRRLQKLSEMDAILQDSAER